jgi:hypothetical protein
MGEGGAGCNNFDVFLYNPDLYNAKIKMEEWVDTLKFKLLNVYIIIAIIRNLCIYRHTF